jgi:hypothetical protein
VFQESALNSETVFRCGGETIGAETLMGVMALLAPRLSQVVSSMQLVADKIGPRLLRDLFNPSSSRKLCLSPPQFRIRRRYQSISRKPAGPGLSTFDFLKELYVVSGTQATNKQDRIFGLLAADDAEPLGISADYSGTGIVALFSHVAAAIIMDSGCLDILSFAYNPKDVPGRLLGPGLAAVSEGSIFLQGGTVSVLSFRTYEINNFTNVGAGPDT